MKKLIFWIVVLVLIAAGTFGYSRYMHGNLKINRELLSEENMNLLAENWEQLNIGEPKAMSNPAIPGWIVIDVENPAENATIFVWINTGKDAGSSPFLPDTATFNRVGLMDVLGSRATDHKVGRFGENFNEIFISNSRIAVLFWETGGRSTADTFETWFQKQLEIVNS